MYEFPITKDCADALFRFLGLPYTVGEHVRSRGKVKLPCGVDVIQRMFRRPGRATIHNYYLVGKCSKELERLALDARTAWLAEREPYSDSRAVYEMIQRKKGRWAVPLKEVRGGAE